jgi:hypothetical protein
MPSCMRNEFEISVSESAKFYWVALHGRPEMPRTPPTRLHMELSANFSPTNQVEQHSFAEAKFPKLGTITCSRTYSKDFTEQRVKIGHSSVSRISNHVCPHHHFPTAAAAANRSTIQPNGIATAGCHWHVPCLASTPERLHAAYCVQYWAHPDFARTSLALSTDG